MIKIAEVLPDRPSPLWKMVKQCGVDHVVGGFSNPKDPSAVHPDRRPWSHTNLVRMKTARRSTRPNSASPTATRKSNTPAS